MDTPENEKEIFSIDDKAKIVKTLGIEVAAQPKDIHIYINGAGKDLMKTIVLDSLLITVSVPKPAAESQQPSQ